MTHTHSDIKSVYLRSVLANELLVLRGAMRQLHDGMNSDFVYGVRTGLDTFARRLQDIEDRGLREVYKQNYA
jgi:hypothetical protein